MCIYSLFVTLTLFYRRLAYIPDSLLVLAMSEWRELLQAATTPTTSSILLLCSRDAGNLDSNNNNTLYMSLHRPKHDLNIPFLSIAGLRIAEILGHFRRTGTYM